MQNDSNLLAQKAAEAIDEEFLISLAQKFVQIRSVVEPEHGNTELEAANFIAKTFKELGLTPTIQEVTKNRPNIIADWQGSDYDPKKHKTLMFEGHTDVVTEGDPSTWQYPPFAGKIINGKLYGRGSADMKAGIAAAIAALKAIQQVAPELSGRIRFGIVVDEESMMIGIKDYIDKGWAEEVDAAIIAEPEENELCLFQKGAMRVNVMFTGVMSHGAMPYAGVNPIKALSSFLENLKEFEKSEQARLGEHKYLGLPWITPTIIKAPPDGEAQHNVMPAKTFLALDIRTVPGQEHSAIFAQLEEYARAIEANTDKMTIELDLFEQRPWTQTNEDSPIVNALEQAYEIALKQKPKYGGVPGATDGTFLSAWANIPIVTVGPGDREIPHQKNEFVEISEMINSAKLYAAATIKFLAS